MAFPHPSGGAAKCLCAWGRGGWGTPPGRALHLPGVVHVCRAEQTQEARRKPPCTLLIRQLRGGGGKGRAEGGSEMRGRIRIRVRRQKREGRLVHAPHTVHTGE